MKKADIIMIILVVSLSLMASYFLVNHFFSNSKTSSLDVKTMTNVDSDLPEVNKKIFHKNAINPTVEIIIGQDK